MKKIAMTMMVIGLIATATVAEVEVPDDLCIGYSGAEVFFNETSPGTWEVLVTTELDSRDPLGLASYSIWVYDTPGVSFVQNRMHSLRGGDFWPIGFATMTLLTGYIGDDFNAGNFQAANEYAVHGIGLIPLQIGPPPPFPAPPPYDIDLGVPALIGTLTTPAGLGLPGSQGGFDVSLTLLDETGNGIISELCLGGEVNPIPEPATLSLLGMGMVAILRKRK